MGVVESAYYWRSLGNCRPLQSLTWGSISCFLMGKIKVAKGAKPKMPGMMRLFTGMMIKKMKGIGIDGYQEQLDMAKELGVKIYACNTSMEMMGIKKEDLIDGITVLGAAAFLDIGTDSDMQLFIG